MSFGGGGPKMPSPVMKAPTRIEPALDDRRRRQERLKKKQVTLATIRGLEEPLLKVETLGA